MKMSTGERSAMLAKVRQHIHKRLITSLDSDPLDIEETPAVEGRVRTLIDIVSAQVGLDLTESERALLSMGVVNEVSGMGPLQSLMDDPSVSDILVNGPGNIWVDREGKLERSGIQFDSEAHLRRFVDRFVGRQGKHLDASNPAVDSRLPDGSRLHAIIPPLSPDGIVVSIRRFRTSHAGLVDLVDNGMLSESMAETLKFAVRARINIIFAGGAGTGKTTLLNAISEFVPENERIVTIEDSAELALRHHHVVSLEGRQENSEGRGKHGLRSLIRQALRMRADRIIVGEVRGDEVFEMLQAMTIGHDGSLTTIHANNPQQALKRIETLAMLSDIQAPREAIRDMVDAAIGLIVHVGRLPCGTRKVLSIVEVIVEDDGRQLKELFRYNARGQEADEFPALSKPDFACEAEERGIETPPTLNVLWEAVQ